ncbi:DUF2813 domain-containing protein [Brevibacterium casei]|uniref:DUF2813 domain-containing protein n=1 Tax=Brevibacterium casei TaxID=33889 RepID=UPI0016935751|nr:DUF2813 domain-containing protein [Brevibacterium casei]MCT1766896.1 DUF2813 domain-containing protein [Brevibacterium casei]NJE65488.1 DUF2813 domain-containing protein [Brevibacterium sp. LS14]
MSASLPIIFGHNVDVVPVCSTRAVNEEVPVFVSRIRLKRFRGFEAAELRFDSHVAIVGEPRAGRSDLLLALRRVLHPRSTSARLDPLDIHQPATDELTEVEVSLTDLGNDLEQLFDARLELLNSDTGLPATKGEEFQAKLGVRLCYRARYDNETDTGEHWVDWARDSDPDIDSYSRARRIEREALPVAWIQSDSPLQVRAEGAFRALMEGARPDAVRSALDGLVHDVADATATFSQSEAVAETVTDVLDAGGTALLGVDDPNSVRFVAEDGSLAGLLRALRPALELDDAGTLPLTSHGSTASAILASAEAIAAAKRLGEEGLVVFADDFGDTLDASGAEHVAIQLRSASRQTWISTRRADPLRAFMPEEVIRFTRSHGLRQHHRLSPSTDKKARRAHRDLLPHLLAGCTSKTVVLVEGPHDVEGLQAVARRIVWLGRAEGDLSSRGMRLLSAPGETGGKDRLADLARLAIELGFHVRAIVDNDSPGSDGDLYDELEALTEQLVVLPDRTAIERALVYGLSAPALREAIRGLVTGYDLVPADWGLPDLGNLERIDESALVDAVLRKKLLKKSPGLHAPWVQSLPSGELPPIAEAVLCTLHSGLPGRIELRDP